MTNKLNNAVVITGASKRLGKAMALAFHKAGYSVLIQYHNSKQAAEQLCNELNLKKNHSALALQCQLDKQSSLNSFIKEANEHINDLQLLINNASGFFPTPVNDATEENWHSLIDTNLKAPFFLCKGFQKQLKQSEGNIINLVDIYGERPLAEHSIYSISKAGLIMLCKSLALEFAPEIRVNGIAPGAILWPEQGQDNKKEILEKVALGRTGEEKDIVDTALYLNNANYVTGQIIQVDGGRNLNI
jgi:pteridine reductase